MKKKKLLKRIKILYKYYSKLYGIKFKNGHSKLETEIFCLQLGKILGKDELAVREDLEIAKNKMCKN